MIDSRMRATLVTVRSPNRRAITILLDNRIELGREADGIIVVDARVSRRHVALEPGPDDTVVVIDLGSANGTTLDGIAVDKPTRAHAGSVVQIGDTLVEIGPPRTIARIGLVTEMKRDTDGTRSTIDAVADDLDAADLKPEVLGVSVDEPGTLTVAFSDIEASTQLAVALGDTAWFEVLRRHHELVAAHVHAHRGRIVKHQGDGYMLCFRSARSALLSAIGLERDLSRAERVDGRELRVRIGVHTGEVVVDDDGDLFGKHVVVAARIGAIAQGGEILVSSLVREIAEPRGDISFVDPRAVQLRGIVDVETVWSVDWRQYVPGG
ncbi:MAG: adenylate cyclase [Actinomycetota bacterium]|nr:adenylate cyclase [Actinomycetota bacterium]